MARKSTRRGLRKKRCRCPTGSRRYCFGRCEDISGPTFHPFPNLPLELRLTVWECLLTNLQTVDIHKGFWPKRRVHPSTARRIFHRTGYYLPIILSTCQESRHLVLSKYTRTRILCSEGSRRQTWFNSREDIVHLPWWPELLGRDSLRLSEIRRLAVVVTHSYSAQSYDFIPLLKELSLLPKLQELYLCLHEDNCAYFQVTEPAYSPIRFIDPAEESDLVWDHSGDGVKATWANSSRVAEQEFELDLQWYKQKYPNMQEWKAPKVQVKVMTVGRGGRCCGPNSDWGRIKESQGSVPTVMKTRLRPEENRKDPVPLGLGLRALGVWDMSRRLFKHGMERMLSFGSF